MCVTSPQAHRLALTTMSDCTPYLLQLGLTKSMTSLVWIAGPLSGLVMQPVVGIIADRSRSKWGRRRPFMIGGSVLVGLCLIVLGWTADIVGTFISDPPTVSFSPTSQCHADPASGKLPP